jgi:hypothetical protein
MSADEFEEETLRGYLAESLTAERMAAVEKSLRESAELRARLEDVRQNRGDLGLHTLGAIWRRNRLTCPTRAQLGSYLLEALDPEQTRYLTFHLTVIACPFCLANYADLKQKSAAAPAADTRHKRFFHSSRHLLSGDE